MNKIKLMLLIPFIAILCSIFIIILDYNYKPDDTSIDLDIFKNLAKNSTCSDIANKLFTIDNQIVFWRKEGSCSDASYSYILFGNNPNEVLCEKFDSIAGPQIVCNNENYKGIFYTIT